MAKTRKKNTKPKKMKKAAKKVKKIAKSRKVLSKKSKNQILKPKLKIKKQKLKRKKPRFKKIAGKKPDKAKGKKAIKRKPKKIIKKPETVKTEPFQAEAFFKARIKVIGVGGGGGSIVSEIGKSLSKATFAIADTDIRALKKRPGIKYFWFGEDLTRGLGTGVNIDLAKQAAEGAKEKISEIFKDQDIIIFVASLGGGLGSGATQVFAEQAKKYGAITFGIFTLPFKFEGKNKSRIALNALKSLRQSLNVSLTIPNEKIFKIIDESTPITSAFSVVNKSLINSLESLIDLIYSPGIINIDFADLRTILKGRGNLAFLNTIEESGKDRADKICQRTFINPLLQNSLFEAEKILFNITGSENLSMFEVEKVSSHIAQQNPKAKIIFGISKNPKLKNKIKTTILMTGGGDKETEEGQEAGILEKKAPVEELKTESRPIIAKKSAKKAEKPRKPASSKKEKYKKKPIKPQKPKKPHSLPVFNPPISVEQPAELAGAGATLGIDEKNHYSKRSTIRRSGLDIKQAEEQEEKERLEQEKEWEIPAFLRKVKFNK